MENASKALLMAAGVLIGVLILSLGVYLFVNFSQHASQTYDQIKEDQINQFNSEFVTLQGKSDITIYDVISTVKRAQEFNNVNELNPADDSFINITVKTAGGDKYDNVNGTLTDNKLTDWINHDKEMMDNAKMYDLAGNLTGEIEVKLPPYKCINIEYNDQQRVKKAEFEFDSETWGKWTT